MHTLANATTHLAQLVTRGAHQADWFYRENTLTPRYWGSLMIAAAKAIGRSIVGLFWRFLSIAIYLTLAASVVFAAVLILFLPILALGVFIRWSVALFSLSGFLI